MCCKSGLFVVLGLLLLCCGEAQALFPGCWVNVDRLNRKLHGQIVDFTKNHGADRRIWSPALCEKRDLYVYLPPCFDPARRYPLAIFLHGASLDEQMFLTFVVQAFDRAIAEGKLPPMIIAAPDGSIPGRPSKLKPASWFVNSRVGNFEDWIVHDVFEFLTAHFPIRPEREQHALIGVSMGGGAAVGLAIKHRDRFKIAMGFMPAVNLRWVDCHGKYQRPFDPCCWGWRSQRRPLEIIGRTCPVPVPFGVLFNPVLGRGSDAMERLASFNPIELMDMYDLKDGELAIYLAYGGKDEFNITAQADSFLYRAQQRDITVGVDFDPNGRHDLRSGRRFIAAALDWAAAQFSLPRQEALP